jgi:ribosomal protein S7
MIPETLEHQLQITRASALTMRVLYLRRLAERLRWLVQQTEESGNVERAKRFAKELAKTEAKLQKAEQERAHAGSQCHTI